MCGGKFTVPKRKTEVESPKWQSVNKRKSLSKNNLIRKGNLITTIPRISSQRAAPPALTIKFYDYFCCRNYEYAKNQTFFCWPLQYIFCTCTGTSRGYESYRSYSTVPVGNWFRHGLFHTFQRMWPHRHRKYCVFSLEIQCTIKLR